MQRRAPAPPIPDAIGVRAIAARSPGLGGLGADLNRAPTVQRLAALRSGLTMPRSQANVAQLHPAPVVQRAMEVDLLDPAPAAQAAKMEVVVATLRRMGAEVIPEVQLNIYIVNDPDKLETNPAETKLVPRVNPAFRRIDIKLRSWYIAISSVGEIIAMIGHELGVHSLTDLEMTKSERKVEKLQSRKPYVAAIAGADRPLAPIVKGAEDRRQTDHVNVAKFKVARNLPGHVPGAPLPRMRQYIQTMLRLGKQIAAAPVGPGGEYANAPARQRALNEMFQTFLLDMGRLIATDDGPAWAIGIGTGDIAAVLNWLRTYLIQTHAAQYPWLNTVTIAPATRMSLVGVLGSILTRTLWEQRGAIARQAGRGLRALPGYMLGAAAGGVRAGLGWAGGFFAPRAPGGT
jgi:hypothetical protein